MMLPGHKTKIVCTIGPASRSVPALRAMMRAGMGVARINLSHGSLDEHTEDVRNIRSIARELNRPIPILADLPGPKIRLGRLSQEPLVLKKGDQVRLTIEPGATGCDGLIPVDFPELPQSVRKGGTIFVSDGIIRLKVLELSASEVRCRVVTGGEIYSRKGINLPGARVLAEPVSDKELALVEFGLEQGIDVFGVSFVEKASDIMKVKEFARSKGKEVYAVAKIERSQAIRNIDEILEVSDGIMVARGDLGVELPIEEIAVIQKKLITKANMLSRPVITATQMLLSMTDNTRPTRAESTDVANAILDGTDAIMLSEETAVGKYPAEAVRMMGRIAASAERLRKESQGAHVSYGVDRRLTASADTSDVIARTAIEAARRVRPRLILTPSRTGATARRISRFKPDQWIFSFSPSEGAVEFLGFSYGVYPFLFEAKGEDWLTRMTSMLKEAALLSTGDQVVLTQGQFSSGHRTTDSMAIIRIP
jgi:pyruvate kinase